jgi:hypothetical protein
MDEFSLKALLKKVRISFGMNAGHALTPCLVVLKMGAFIRASRGEGGFFLPD